MLEAEEGAKDSVLSDTNFYEVTIASVDQPKLLSRLSEALVSTDRIVAGLLMPSHG